LPTPPLVEAKLITGVRFGILYPMKTYFPVIRNIVHPEYRKMLYSIGSQGFHEVMDARNYVC
jgi:hypothetical protein